MIFLKRGFSLVEILLVLTVMMSMSMIKFRDIKESSETLQSKIVGEQIKTVGDAVNNYIAIKYSLLAQLKPSTNTPLDSGYRVCNSNYCTITTQSLISEGLLPQTFSGKNILGSGYEIVLKRTGVSPNFIINGLISTNKPWTEGKLIRYDLLGKAMQYAGADSGVTRNDDLVTGYGGVWSEKKLDYPNIKSKGLLSYRAGYNSSVYSSYLRRDGTLPMVGDLNLDHNNIYNINNLTATGTISTTGDITTTQNISGKDLRMSGNGQVGGNLAVNGYVEAIKDITSRGWLTAHNGGGNKISIGGDASPHPDGSIGNDYEIKMDTAKQLTIWNTAISGHDNAKTLLAVWGSQDIAGNLNVFNNNTAAGNIVASGNVAGTMLIVNSTYNVGDPCSSNGAISKNTNGQILSCQSGRWSKQFVPSIIVRNDGLFGPDADVQYCNDDEAVVGGGGECEDPGYHFIHHSAPSGNGWVVNCFTVDPSRYPDKPAKAFAICMKK